MSIAFKCTNCGRGLRANPEMAGKRTKCPGCATILTIPAGGDAAPAPAPAPKPAAKPAAPAPAPAPAAAPAAMVTCDCGAKIRTKPEWAGKTIKCPKCENRIKVPGAAPAPAPAPTRKPAPPPPAEDDPFGGGFGGPTDDPFAGGNENFSSEPFGGGENFGDGGESEEMPVTKPARRSSKSAPPAKKKGGGGRVILYSLLLLVLLGGAGFAAWAFYFNEPAKVIAPAHPIAKGGGKVIDDEDDGDKMPTPPAKVDDKDKKPVDPIPEEKDPPKVDVPKKDPNDPPAVAGKSVFDLVSGDSFAFVSVKPQALFKTDLGKKMLGSIEEGPGAKDYKEFVEKFGVSVGDLEHALLIMPTMPAPDGANAIPGVFIIATTKAIDNAGFKAAADAKMLQLKTLPEGPSYYLVANADGPEQIAVVQVDAKTVVVGKEAQFLEFMTAMSTAAEKGPKQGPLSAHLKAASVSKQLVNVGFQAPKETLGMILEGAPPGEKKDLTAIAEFKTGLLTLNADQTVKLVAKLQYDSPAKAVDAKNSIAALLAKANEHLPEMKPFAPKEFAAAIDIGEAVLKTIMPTADGNDVEVPVEVKMSLDEASKFIADLVGKWQSAPKKALAPGNLQYLALAMHSYHDNYRRLPDAQFKKGLSWRVAVLPYVEQLNLYKQFNLEEPWDSDHNKKLLEAMPKVFEHPDRPAPPGHTYFRVFAGPSGATIYDAEGKTKLSLGRIADGTTNTFLIVEGETAVPWTKFDELIFTPEGPLPKLGQANRFFGTMADGSVFFFNDVRPDVLKALITTNGGEPLGLAEAIPGYGGAKTPTVRKGEILEKKLENKLPFDEPKLEPEKKNDFKLPLDEKKSSRLEIVAPRHEFAARIERRLMRA